jgi:hypothetical protein
MDTKAWEINESDYSKEVQQKEKLKFLIRYAILAPSGHNAQPWRFAVDDEWIKVLSDHSRALPVVDPDGRELNISIGCAVENLITAAKHFGNVPEVRYFPDGIDGECAAKIGISKSVAAGENDLFNSITKRHTNRGLYEDRPIQPENLDKLTKYVIEGLRVDFLKSNDIKKEIADMAANGDILQFNNPQYRKELGYWVGQGAFGQKGITAKLGKFFISHINSGKKVSEEEKKLIESCPMFAVISSMDDDKLSWIKTGEIYQRIALATTGMGIMQHPMNQGLIEVPENRERLRKLLGINEIPQFAFRLGYAKPVKHQVRRPIEEALVS